MVLRPLESWGDVGQRVAEARVAARLTQGQLAAEMGIDRSAVAKVESGRRNLSSLELARLASALDRPIEWFVSEPPPAVVSRRSEQLEGTHGIDTAAELFARDVELLLELGALQPVEAGPIPIPESAADAEAAARHARGRSELPDGPVTNLGASAEQLGLYVASMTTENGGVDGAYLALQGGGATVINGSQPTGRRRFTLAHELGHHVIQDEYSTDWAVTEPRDERERRLNAFAIHFLMPRASVTRNWSEWGGREDPRAAAVRIGVEYRASWTATCTQLQNLGLTDHQAAQRLRAAPPTKADYVELELAVVEELTPPYLSPRFGQAVLRAYRGGKISAGRAVELLRGTVEEDDLPPPDEVPVDALRGELPRAG
jgi:Zn-dependent peptidase ImmA (M78 family)/DNA-binding XRE family transcriptional regulator